jgi:hypothetical protein
MQDDLCGITQCIMELKGWFCDPNKDAYYAHAYTVYV